MAQELSTREATEPGPVWVEAGWAGPAVLPVEEAAITPDPARVVRLHLARELHDGVAEKLTVMLVELENFRARQSGRLSVLSEVDLLQAAARDALTSLRELLDDLRDRPRGRRDFAAWISEDLIPAFRRRTGIEVNLRVHRSWPRQLPAGTALHLYRILEQAINNTARHAEANSVEITLARGRDQVVMEVRDDGRGLAGDHRTRNDGLGLTGMRERALLIGGSLRVRPGRTGGVAIRTSFPL